MIPPQAERVSGRKRKLSAEAQTTNAPLPAAKSRKQEQTKQRGPPPAFWDNLSRLWLTPRALREFDRRASQIHTPRRRDPTALQPVCTTSLKRFARHGGPNLSDIRAVSDVMGDM